MLVKLRASSSTLSLVCHTPMPGRLSGHCTRGSVSSGSGQVTNSPRSSSSITPSYQGTNKPSPRGSTKHTISRGSSYSSRSIAATPKKGKNGIATTKQCTVPKKTTLGLVPKKSGGWGTITHLSAPAGSSVNDFIPMR